MLPAREVWLESKFTKSDRLIRYGGHSKRLGGMAQKSFEKVILAILILPCLSVQLLCQNPLFAMYTARIAGCWRFSMLKGRSEVRFATRLESGELARSRNALVSFGQHQLSSNPHQQLRNSIPSLASFLKAAKMSSPKEAWQQLQRMAQQTGRGGPSPKGMGAGIGALVLLGGLTVVGNNALFNVDGGHRAIKYTRLGGVGKEIYSEGIASVRTNYGWLLTANLPRYTSENSMV